MTRQEISQELSAIIAVQATGCNGAGNYLNHARQQGYTHLEVLNWSSSAGDWQFIVSQDGFEWFIMYQENNYPRAGFTRTIDDSQVFYGTVEEVLTEIFEMYS